MFLLIFNTFERWLGAAEMIKYCSRCKKIFDSKLDKCQFCEKKLIENPAGESPVCIMTSGGFELERIKSALESESIPCSVSNSKGNIGMKILNEGDLGENDVIVPLAFYNEARELLIGIGAMKPEDGEITVPEDISVQDLDSEMTPRKRFWVRLASIILFVLIVWIVVAATDAGIALIKSLFGA